MFESFRNLRRLKLLHLHRAPQVSMPLESPLRLPTSLESLTIDFELAERVFYFNSSECGNKSISHPSQLEILFTELPSLTELTLESLKFEPIFAWPRLISLLPCGLRKLDLGHQYAIPYEHIAKLPRGLEYLSIQTGELLGSESEIFPTKNLVYLSVKSTSGIHHVLSIMKYLPLTLETLIWQSAESLSAIPEGTNIFPPNLTALEFIVHLNTLEASQILATMLPAGLERLSLATCLPAENYALLPRSLTVFDDNGHNSHLMNRKLLKTAMLDLPPLLERLPSWVLHHVLMDPLLWKLLPRKWTTNSQSPLSRLAKSSSALATNRMPSLRIDSELPGVADQLEGFPSNSLTSVHIHVCSQWCLRRLPVSVTSLALTGNQEHVSPRWLNHLKRLETLRCLRSVSLLVNKLSSFEPKSLRHLQLQHRLLPEQLKFGPWSERLESLHAAIGVTREPASDQKQLNPTIQALIRDLFTSLPSTLRSFDLRISSAKFGVASSLLDALPRSLTELNFQFLIVDGLLDQHLAKLPPTITDMAVWNLIGPKSNAREANEKPEWKSFPTRLQHLCRNLMEQWTTSINR